MLAKKAEGEERRQLRHAQGLRSMPRQGALSAIDYYNEYHGHRVEDLTLVISHFKSTRPATPLMWLAGDSSLDSKYWFSETSPAINGYEEVLHPSTMKKDVCFSLNREFISRKRDMVCINTAIEATSIGDRACGRLLKQDVILRDNISSRDCLVVSIGGNDIALKPNPGTILNMLFLMCCLPESCIDGLACGCAIGVDDCCCGCGSSCLSNLCACPPGLGYFIHLFKVRIESYISRLCAKTTPKTILLCMIYFPDEMATGSWADGALGILGYNANANPGKLQKLIQIIFKLATQRVRVPGTEVVAVPLYEAMNGKNTRDYCQRVEPSPQGAAKMSSLLLDYLEHREQGLTLSPREAAVEVSERED